MTRIASLLLICACIGEATAFAQAQRASIEGTVRDVLGGAMSGVSVEARSPSRVGVASTRTDDRGAYRFPALAPGTYELTAIRQGFLTRVLPDVVVELGQTIKVDLVLEPAAVTAEVSVRSESPLIDVKQSAAGGTMNREIIDRIPKGRDFSGLVTFVPGVDQENRNRGLQIDGASGADNRFFIDGIDHTDMYRGTLQVTSAMNKTLPNDFVEAVLVQSSGYSAEYRASIGGVISAVTKSGGNVWRGSVGTYFTSDGLQGAIRPTLQLNPANQKVAEYVLAPPDAFRDWEMAAGAGGPLVRNRLWLQVGFAPHALPTSRTVTFRSTQQRATFETKPVDRIVTYTASAQLSERLWGRIAGLNERARLGTGLPGILTDGTSNANPALFPAINERHTFKDSISATLNWVPTSRTFVSFILSRLRYGGQDQGTFSDALRHVFVGSNFQFAEIPAEFRRVSGFIDAPSSSRFVRDTFARNNASVEVTRYGNWHGAHSLKAGLQFERMTNDVLSGDQASTVALVWDASYVAIDGRRERGPYGYYQVSRFYTQGDVRATNTSLFVQDAWTPFRNVTFNLGLRIENERVPSYRPENPGVRFGFADKIAPRVGAVWDVRGDSRWKVYGDWGVFHDLMKLAMSRVMFGADRWVNYYYTLDSFNWPALVCDGTDCPGKFIDRFDNRKPANQIGSNLVDPNLQPAQTQEVTLGLEHELTRTISLSARLVHKWTDRVIEAVCDQAYSCGVNNPGFGTAVRPFGDAYPVQPAAERVYDSAEVRFRKRHANRWSLDASYLLSRLWGNWSGINSSDEAVSCLQPNSCLAFDLLYYSYDASGQSTTGLLATDRPHRFKALGTYDLPWGTQIGVNYRIESGRPVSTVARMRTDGINFFPYGRGDLGRTPVLSQTDLLIQQRLPLGTGRVQLRVGVNVINLFDQMAVTNIATNPYRDAFNIPATQFFAGFDPAAIAAATPSMRPNPQYGMANNYQPRRSITLQARLTF